MQFPKVTLSKLATIEELDYFSEALATVEHCDWALPLLRSLNDHDTIVSIKLGFNAKQLNSCFIKVFIIFRDLLGYKLFVTDYQIETYTVLKCFHKTLISQLLEK